MRMYNKFGILYSFPVFYVNLGLGFHNIHLEVCEKLIIKLKF